MKKKYSRYIALGDGYSIDKYPLRDGGQGAAALFASYLARGGTVPTFLAGELTPMTSIVRRQLRLLDPGDDECVVTVTVGQDDLLRAWAETGVERTMRTAVAELEAVYRSTLYLIGKHLPRATIIASTVPDPSDGTGVVPGLFGAPREPHPSEWVKRFNDYVRRVVTSEANAHLADLAVRFAGHGHGPDSWYCTTMPLEPNAAGARAIARSWHDTLSQLHTQAA